MASSRWHEHGFIDVVAGRRGYAVEHRRGGSWTLRGVATTPRGDRFDWACVCDPAFGERDASIVWEAAAIAFDDRRVERRLRIDRADDGATNWFADADGAVGAVAVALAGAASIGRRFLRRNAPPPPSPAAERAEPAVPVGPLGAGWTVDDPMGVIDGELAGAVTSTPLAWHGPQYGDRPVVFSVWLNQYGLQVSSGGWWDSADALDRQITIGVTLAGRLGP